MALDELSDQMVQYEITVAMASRAAAFLTPHSGRVVRRRNVSVSPPKRVLTRLVTRGRESRNDMRPTVPVTQITFLFLDQYQRLTG